MGEATDKIKTTNWDEDQFTSIRDDDPYVEAEPSDHFMEDTEQLRADIEDTRADMSQTINEIQERLSPEYLMGQVKETVREATIGKVERVMDRVADATEPAREAMGRAGTAIKETGMSVGNSMWKNPIPVALIGIGLGMLMFRGKRGNGRDYKRGYDYDNELPQRTRGAGQNFTGNQSQYSENTGTGAFNQVKETASDLANRSTTALSNLGTKAKESASNVGTRLGHVLRENPLAVGAVAVAAGTAVGLALPSTRLENEYVGEASEKLVDKAQEVARQAIDKVQNAAEQMTNEGQPNQ